MNIIWYHPDVFHSNEKRYEQYGENVIITLTMFGKIYPLVELCDTNVVQVNNQLYCLDLKG